MKNIVLFLFAVYWNLNIISQKPFTIESSIDTTDFYDAIYDMQLSQDSVFYEDSLYKVRQTCSGEWGGSVWFMNKKTKVEYSCNATCPKSVNYFNGKYYVTASLAHLIGHSIIITIEDPDSMKLNETAKSNRLFKQKIQTIGSNESFSVKGTEYVVDTFEVIIIASFIQKNELYHIVTDYNGAYLSKIIGNKLHTINIISDEYLPLYNSELLKTEKDEIVIVFDKNDSKGYLKIEDSKIILKRFK